jgi:NAD(P)-dependent dehydrogenase (short-subunit alcohol dehydrogenase family)
VTDPPDLTGIDLFRFDGRRAVVTGCSSGIGQATAVLLGELGASVVGIDVRPPTVALADFVACDLSDPHAVDSAGPGLGRVDVLCNCAGLSGGAADTMTVFKVNFLGLRRLTEQVVAGMAPGGAVASVASLGGQGWEANVPTWLELVAVDDWDSSVAWCEEHPHLFERGGYGPSKQALIVYTKQRATAWARRGVRVNVIGPSTVDTPMLADTVRSVGAAYLENFPRPLGRNSTPEEQASVLAFLASPAASYVTGQLIWTDGAYTAGVLTGEIAPPTRSS